MKFILISVFAIFLFSCKENPFNTVVEVDLPEEPTAIVINSVLDVDSTIMVELSESRWVMDSTAISPVMDGKVWIVDDAGSRTDLLPSFAGQYIASLKPAEGRSYHITAQSPRLPTCSAKVNVPIRPVIKNMVVRDSVRKLQNSDTYIDDIEILLANQSGENYYEVGVYLYDSLFGYMQMNFINLLGTDLGVNEEYVLKIFISEDLFAGGDYLFHIYLPKHPYQPGIGSDDYYVKLSSISREYYLYQQAVMNQDMSRFNPFAEPVPVISNNSSGMGIAGASASILRKID